MALKSTTVSYIRLLFIFIFQSQCLPAQQVEYFQRDPFTYRELVTNRRAWVKRIGIILSQRLKNELKVGFHMIASLIKIG